MRRRVADSTPPAPLKPEQVRYVHRVLRRQTHPAAPGTLCRCGGCLAVLIELADAVNATPQQLRELIGVPEAPAGTRAPRPRRPLHSPVGVPATIRVNGQVLGSAEGLLRLAARTS
ncbi:hypothetical protein OHA21_17570 [Actinoplanes sp. NBC_00393]|uniref:hypothetical protein n=1 Tax=Actinoplanes sp. NBC_00393 TaxID=2975953 RepID=UPI002E1E66EF